MKKNISNISKYRNQHHGFAHENDLLIGDLITLSCSTEYRNTSKSKTEEVKVYMKSEMYFLEDL